MNATGKDEGFVAKPKPFQGKGLVCESFRINKEVCIDFNVDIDVFQTYEDTFRQSSSANCTVYVCGVGECDEPGLRNTFDAFGKIEEIR